MANVGMAPSSHDLDLRCADVMPRAVKISHHKSQQTAAPLIPPKPTIANLRTAAAGCKACDLWEQTTQTVYGEGSLHAKVVFAGQQPGHRENLDGHPFVCPPSRLLDP